MHQPKQICFDPFAGNRETHGVGQQHNQVSLKRKYIESVLFRPGFVQALTLAVAAMAVAAPWGLQLPQPGPSGRLSPLIAAVRVWMEHKQ